MLEGVRSRDTRVWMGNPREYIARDAVDHVIWRSEIEARAYDSICN